MCSSTCRVESDRARNGGQQRQGVVAGARSEADVQDRADREHREQDALQQAQRAGQFVQQQLRRERRGQNQRHGVEAERVEGDGAARVMRGSERQFERIGRMVQIGRDGGEQHHREQANASGAPAEPGNQHHDA